MVASRPAEHEARHLPRFPLRLPVWFRMTTETEWHSGTTESISATGASVQTTACLPLHGPIVIVIALPPAGWDSGGCLIGVGEITRAPEPVAATTACSFSIAVTGYRIDHRDDALNLLSS
jgi:hypothetical protein